MENFYNNDNDNRDFERFVKKELTQIQENAPGDTWAKIARQQQPINFMAKLKRWGLWVGSAAALAVVAALIWGHNPTNQPNGGQSVSPGTITVPVQSPASPVASDTTLDMAQTAAPAPISPSAMALPEVKQVPGAAGLSSPIPKWYKQNRVPVAQIRFDAAEGISYQNPESGTNVRIAPNSLVYANGRPVTGQVDLWFREYRSIPDVLAANIPMHYGDERGDFFFNSGGMFDVRVSQNSEELFIAPGSVYDVRFAPNNELTAASLFYLDNQTNEWGYLSDKPFAQANTTFDARADLPKGLPPVSSEETVLAENAQNKEENCLPSIPGFFPVFEEEYTPDGPLVSPIKTGVAVGQKLATGEQTLPIWYKRNPMGDDTYFTYAMDRSEIRLVYANDEDIRFFPQDANGIYKEFAAFKDFYFIRTGDSLPVAGGAVATAGTVDHIFKNTKVWRSFTVTPSEEGTAKCLIMLGTEREGFIRINAQLVRSAESTEEGMFDAGKIFKKYAQLREERMNGMLTELRGLRNFIQAAPMFQQEKEWCLTERDWLQYFENNLPIMRARYQRLVNEGMASDHVKIAKAAKDWRLATRERQLAQADRLLTALNGGRQLGAVLSLTGFGTYNCDQIFRLTKRPIYAAVRFVSATTGAPIVATQLSLLEKQTKMFFNMKSSSSIVLLPGRKTEVIVTDNKGKYYHMTGADYERAIAKKAGTYTMTLTDVSNTMQKPSDWADLLGL